MTKLESIIQEGTIIVSLEALKTQWTNQALVK